MKEDASLKKQSEGQGNLYRLLRLQNRENHFFFRDPELMTQLRVRYQHFPLETISHCDLLKTFWKFITTHYFKKIDEEELYRLTYIRNLFSKYQKPHPPSSLRLVPALRQFCQQLTQIIDPQYLQDLFDECQDNPQTRIWLKNMCLTILDTETGSQKKTRQINKRPKNIKKVNSKSKMLSKKEQQFILKEAELDELMGQLQQMDAEEDIETQRDDIDEEIQRLEAQLDLNSRENAYLLDDLQLKIRGEEEQNQIRQYEAKSGRDAQCIQGLIHSLQEKQIAQSVSKIVSCERKDGEQRFQVLYETALNLLPQLLNETALKKLNQLRETSLLKFYKTGVKSTYSVICQNFAGFADLSSNRMSVARHKQKDYLQVMKRMVIPHPEVRQSLEEFDTCHHCKFMYPSSILVACKFTSDRQSVPKISESQTDFGEDLNLQKGRVSQRFVAKHRNCLTGYARINEEYVCGRKYCKSCLKDNYGSEWMRRNNGMCPFCEGVCSCTRCVRNEKMNKIKAFFISLGGDVAKLQAQGLIEQLPQKSCEMVCRAKSRPKKNARPIKIHKTKRIVKEQVDCWSKIKTLSKRRREKEFSGRLMEQQLQKWSSTAEKELQISNLNRRSARKGAARLFPL